MTSFIQHIICLLYLSLTAFLTIDATEEIPSSKEQDSPYTSIIVQKESASSTTIDFLYQHRTNYLPNGTHELPGHYDPIKQKQSNKCHKYSENTPIKHREIALSRPLTGIHLCHSLDYYIYALERIII